MSDLAADKVEEARNCFEVFDKRYEGKVDCFYIADMLRSLGLNPTNAMVEKKGGQSETGKKSLKFEEFLPIYSEFLKVPVKSYGTYEDFMEGLKLFDKESNGMMGLAELSQTLRAMAEKITAEQCEEILKLCNIVEDEDGNINYENFVRKVLAGPFPGDKL